MHSSKTAFPGLLFLLRATRMAKRRNEITCVKIWAKLKEIRQGINCRSQTQNVKCTSRTKYHWLTAVKNFLRTTRQLLYVIHYVMIHCKKAFCNCSKLSRTEKLCLKLCKFLWPLRGRLNNYRSLRFSLLVIEPCSKISTSDISKLNDRIKI